jgi:PAS domain S-box-containing protein
MPFIRFSLGVELLRAARASLALPAPRWPAVGLGVVLAAAGVTVRGETVRVGFDSVIDPVAFVDGTGQPEGFAADYVRAVAREAGIQIEFVTGRKEQLQAEFRDGRISVIAVLAFTEERAKVMDFGLPYLTLKSAVFARRGGPPMRTVADFSGRRVAVSRGNFTHNYLLAHPEWGAQLVPVDSTEAALRAVEAGECDAAVNVDLVAQKIVRDHQLTRVERASLELPELTYKYHMAVHRGDTALLRRLNEAQLLVHERGEFARIYERWIGPLRRDGIMWQELRPLLVPAVLVVLLVTVALLWQRHNLRQLSRHAAELRASQTRLGLVLESGRHSLWDWDFVTGRVNRSPMLAVSLGYQPDEVPNTSDGINLLLHPDDRAAADNFQKLVAAPGSDEFSAEVRIRAKDGSWRWIASVGRVLERGPDGRARRAVGTHTDITDRKDAERALRESEARFRRLTENAPDVIFRYRFEPAPGYDYISPAVERISGYGAEEFYADPLLASKLAHPDDRDKVRALLATREPPVGAHEIKWMARDGHTVITEQRFVPIRDERGKVVALEGIARDITEVNRELEQRRALEVQLIQAQKMETIGVLAGGIAHDFNNVLTGILGFAEIGRLSLRDGRTVGDCLEEIRKAGLRARDLVAQILAFSRRREAEQMAVDLSRLVGEAVKFLRASTPATIRIDRYLDTGTVRADPTQIHQVVLNLATNALHAMRERPAGVLTIRVEPVVIDAALAAATMPRIAPGSYMCLLVRDTGHGMDAQTVAHIFDPFFTTKPGGEGTGLGLAVVHGIVRAHHGGMTVESRVGEGSAFSVYLPVFAGSAATPAAPAAPLAPGHGEHVLFVDDEVTVGQFAGARLEQLQYRVTIFNDPLRALAAVRSSPQAYDVVVSDFAMPGLGGLDFVGQLRDCRRDFPAVIITGNRAAVSPARLAAMGRVAVVDKPFTGDDLARAVQSVLPAPAAAGQR